MLKSDVPCKYVSVSGQAYSAEYSGGQDALIKRGYILHSLEGGNPRYRVLYSVPAGYILHYLEGGNPRFRVLSSVPPGTMKGQAWIHSSLLGGGQPQVQSTL